jgi:uncharacterized protein YheU (UPF0270 family)
MIITPDQLSAEALDALVEEYCLREHGCNDTEEPLGTRKSEIRRQVARGEMVILYTPNNPNQVATLVPRERLKDSDFTE